MRWARDGSTSSAGIPAGPASRTHVRCFANDRGQERFWGRDWSVPTTAQESLRYLPKTVGVREALRGSERPAAGARLDRRHGPRSRLSAPAGRRPTADLSGVSYGTLIGETYANMFPRRVRAMVLDGVIDPVAFTTSTEAGIANSVADFDRVFAKFQSLCQARGRRVARSLATARSARRVSPAAGAAAAGADPGAVRARRTGSATAICWSTCSRPRHPASGRSSRPGSSRPRAVTDRRSRPTPSTRAPYQSALIRRRRCSARTSRGRGWARRRGRA